jgi:DNA-binding winged helix-turn-helix (wHTH) protein
MRVRFGNCAFDERSRTLERDGQPVTLTEDAHALLTLLVQHCPHTLSKAELVDRIWPTTSVADDALELIVSEVRAATGESAADRRWIRSVGEVGYAFGDSDRAVAIPPSGHWVLTWATRWFVLAPGENIIGRDPAAAVSVDAEIISRRHARIVVTPDTAVLEDLGSKNGTYLGVTRITTPQTLHRGDQIRIGDFIFTVETGHTAATS